jgi:anthranilate synthase component 1
VKTAELPDAITGAYASFESAALSHEIVPMAVELHADSLTPVGAFERFVGAGVGFLLESVEDGLRYGRFSFLGRRPLGTLVCWPNGDIEAKGFSEGSVDSALSAVEAHLASVRVAELIGITESPVPLRSGVVGLFGWDTVRSIETLPPRQSSTSDQPDTALMSIGELIVFDHWRQSVTLIANIDTADRTDFAAKFAQGLDQLRVMMHDLGQPAQEYLRPARSRSELPIAHYDRTVTSSEYRLMVEAAREEIAQGEVFQVVLAQRFDVGPVEDPFGVYRVLRQMNPSAYLYYLQFADVRVAGSSPEPLVRVRDGRVTVRPIAGSRPRGDNERENALRAASLKEDPKEIAEHVMLVDLGRNDVGRVAKYGTIEVEELMTVEVYSHIMHLTSQVSGLLREDVSAVEVLRATFPAGTLSGAPKVRAMQLITEMEPQARGLYGGAVGYFDSSGNLDAAILIRTLVVDRAGNGSVQTGAGIVWDSDPEAEDQECLAKAEAVLRAVGGARE